MMKTLLFLSILLFTLSVSQSHVSAAFEPVLDVSGKKLRPGTGYYILPVIRGRGGGLTLTKLSYESCPLGVVQARSELDNGLPVTFSPFNGDNVVRVSTDLNFRFPASTVCKQSMVWRLDSSVTGTPVVSSGGVEGNPGRETIGNWFKIEKDGVDYSIVYCPTVCDICRPICGKIGVVVEKNGNWRLRLSEVPHKVMFKKA